MGSSNCGRLGRGWSRVWQVSSLNGDLNQGSGGKYIYLCQQTGGSTAISGLLLSESGSSGWSKVQGDPLNGDLNQGAGGKYIYLLQQTGGSTAVSGLLLSESGTCPRGWLRVQTLGSLNGDLNQG